jgi:hypothetical protein
VAQLLRNLYDWQQFQPGFWLPAGANVYFTSKPAGFKTGTSKFFTSQIKITRFRQKKFYYLEFVIPENARSSFTINLNLMVLGIV